MRALIEYGVQCVKLYPTNNMEYGILLDAFEARNRDFLLPVYGTGTNVEEWLGIYHGNQIQLEPVR